MKKIVVSLSFILLLISLVHCSSSSGSSATGNPVTQPPAGEGTPADVVQDTTEEDSEFDYSTVKTVSVDLELYDEEGNPLSQAVVIVYDADANEITRSVSDNTGNATFNITINRTDTTITVTIQHPDYAEKTFTVDNIDELASISRKLYLEALESGTEIADSDNDGIGDELDAFPDDPRYVSMDAATYTIAYEDLYPEKGDADFNDLVVKLDLEEYLNAENKISKIIVTAKVLASGAGYNNQFGITVLGERHLLVEDTKAVLENNWNTSTDDKSYFDADPVILVIEPDVPVARSSVAPMPYDPFCIADGVAGNEVHLPFVTTDFEGKVLDSDGFPWAILVPEDWQWPREDSDVFSAYPDFSSWYLSGGIEHKDWYLNAEEHYIYQK